LFNIPTLFIVLSVFFLVCASIIDFSIYFSLLFINLLLLFILKDVSNYDVFFLIVPCVISCLGKKKYSKLLLYSLCSVILSFFNRENIVSSLISISLISLLYMAIPSFLLSQVKELIMNPINSLELYEKKYKRKNKEVELELSKFTNLFNLIVEEYDKDNDKRLERKKEDVIYRSLCINCHKNKVCYSRKGVFKDLMLKSIESELNEEDIHYVNKECLKPSKFFELSELFKRDYYKEYKYNLEYKGLKEALKSQLLGLSKVIDNYKECLLYDHSLNINYENEIIKNKLDKYQYDVLYVNVSKDFKDNYIIDLCVKINNHQVIYKIKDIISRELNINLEIKEVNEFSVEGFLKIELIEVREYKFSYGVYQINCSEEGNGDSYLVFENNNYMLYCLSDGMGVGKLAKEESSFTLKLLKSILETGMDLRNSIMLINSLLKVKNRFDMYATLDLVSINKRNLKSHFFKNGAVHSYIFSNIENKMIEVNTSSLPIGIVDCVNSFDFSFKLKKDDFIIMFSDGIKEDIQSFETFFKNIKGYNPQIIAHELASKFKNVNEVDDVSVLVIKIEK
jgi:stage II sporulation protein E